MLWFTVTTERRRRPAKSLGIGIALPSGPGLAPFPRGRARPRRGCGAMLLRLRIDRNFHLRRLPYDAPALLFVIIGLLSVAVAPDKAFSFYNFYHLVPIYALTYLLVGQTLRTPHELRRVGAAAGPWRWRWWE